MYRQSKDLNGNINGVCRLADNAFIPFDPTNTDYQEFLRWCEAGNQPMPAEE